jgi:hypothetical protein
MASESNAQLGALEIAEEDLTINAAEDVEEGASEKVPDQVEEGEHSFSGRPLDRLRPCIASCPLQEVQAVLDAVLTGEDDHMILNEALETSCSELRVDATELLLKQGANPNAPGRYGPALLFDICRESCRSR